jgi:hypothetical protein
VYVVSKYRRVAGTVRDPLRAAHEAEPEAESEETLARARALVGAEQFTGVWEQGRDMSLEQAVACALEEGGSVLQERAT